MCTEVSETGMEAAASVIDLACDFGVSVEDKTCLYVYVSPSRDAECQAECSTVESGEYAEIVRVEESMEVEREVDEATCVVSPSTTEISVQAECALIDSTTCVDVSVDDKACSYEWVSPTSEESVQAAAVTVETGGSVTTAVSETQCEASCDVIDSSSDVCVVTEMKESRYEFVVDKIDASCLASASVIESSSSVCVDVASAETTFAYLAPVSDASTLAVCEVSDQCGSVEVSVDEKCEQASATLTDMGLGVEQDVSHRVCHVYADVEEAVCVAGATLSDLVEIEVQTEDLDVEEVIQITTAKKDHAEFFQRVSKMKGGEDNWCQTDLSLFNLVERRSDVSFELLETGAFYSPSCLEKGVTTSVEIVDFGGEFVSCVIDSSTAAEGIITDSESSDVVESLEKVSGYEFSSSSCDAFSQVEVVMFECGVCYEQCFEEKSVEIECLLTEASCFFCPLTCDSCVQAECIMVDSMCLVDEVDDAVRLALLETEVSAVAAEGQVDISVPESPYGLCESFSFLSLSVNETGTETDVPLCDSFSFFSLHGDEDDVSYGLDVTMQSDIMRETDMRQSEDSFFEHTLSTSDERIVQTSSKLLCDAFSYCMTLVSDVGLQTGVVSVSEELFDDVLEYEVEDEEINMSKIETLESLRPVEMVDAWSFSRLHVDEASAQTEGPITPSLSISSLVKNLESDKLETLYMRLIETHGYDYMKTMLFGYSEINEVTCDSWSCFEDTSTVTDTGVQAGDKYTFAAFLLNTYDYEDLKEIIFYHSSRNLVESSVQTIPVEEIPLPSSSVEEQPSHEHSTIGTQTLFDDTEVDHSRMIKYVGAPDFNVKDLIMDMTALYQREDLFQMIDECYRTQVPPEITPDERDTSDVLKPYKSFRDSYVQAQVLIQNVSNQTDPLDTESLLDAYVAQHGVALLKHYIDSQQSMDSAAPEDITDSSIAITTVTSVQVSSLLVEDSCQWTHDSRDSEIQCDTVSNLLLMNQESQTDDSDSEDILDAFVKQFGLQQLKDYILRQSATLHSLSISEADLLKMDDTEVHELFEKVSDQIHTDALARKLRSRTVTKEAFATTSPVFLIDADIAFEADSSEERSPSIRESSSQTEQLSVDNALQLAGTSRSDFEADVERHQSALYGSAARKRRTEEVPVAENMPLSLLQPQKSRKKKNKRIQRGISFFSLVSTACGSDYIETIENTAQTDALLSLEELVDPFHPAFLGVELRDRLLALRDSERPPSVSFSSTELLDDPELYRQSRSRRDSGASRTWQFTPITVEGDFMDVNAHMEVVTRTTLTSHQQHNEDLATSLSPQPILPPARPIPPTILRHVTTQASQTDPIDGSYLRSELQWWNEQMDELRSIGTNTTTARDRRVLTDLSSDDSSQTGLPTFTSRHLEISQVIRPSPGAVRSNEWNIDEVVSPRTQQSMPLQLAIQRGIVDLQRGVYIDAVRKMTIPIPTAVERGLVRRSSAAEGPATSEGTHCALLSFIETRNLTVETRTDSYLITTVQDQLRRSPVSINAALSMGLLNWESGLYYNNRTRQNLQLSEAFRLGYLRGERVTASIPNVEVIENTFFRFPDETGN